MQRTQMRRTKVEGHIEKKTRWHGLPGQKGTRGVQSVDTCIATVFENLEDGLSIEEIMEQFDVTREQVTAVLDFAARSLEAPVRR